MQRRVAFSLSVLLSMGSWSCGDDADDGHDTGAGTGSPDQVGQICAAPSECYPEVEDPSTLAGDPVCLDRVRGGYCTHGCGADTDCCAVEGECLTPLPQVCSPFESTGMMMCFLSCESADVSGAGDDDPETFCQREASPDFICRSSGGGSSNRKVCVPGDCGVGARCGADADCATDLVCLTEIDGGYCGRKDCQTNADCPQDSLCVAGPDFDYCARPCSVESDCTFCRTSDHHASCVADATFVETGTAGSVCLVR